VPDAYGKAFGEMGERISFHYGTHETFFVMATLWGIGAPKHLIPD